MSNNSYLRLSSSFRVSCKPAVGKSTVRSSSFIVTFKLNVYPSAPISILLSLSAQDLVLVPSHVSSATSIQIPAILNETNPTESPTKHENVEISEVLGIFSALTPRASGREVPFTSLCMILANLDGFTTIQVNGRLLGWCVPPPPRLFDRCSNPL